MPNQLPEREFVKVIKGGISMTVPIQELSYYTRAGYLEESEEADPKNMTPAELRMSQIEKGEAPDNQVSSVNLSNVDVPATEQEVAVAVHYGPVDSGVPGPAASAEALEDSNEGEGETVKTSRKTVVKKAGR